MLVALMGPPGTGKSEIAAYLASRFPLANLSTDAIRLRHGLPSGPATHEVIYEVALALLPARGGVVWDGIHPTRRHRVAVGQFAAHHRAHFELVGTTAAEGKFVITPAKLAELATWFEPLDPDEPATLVDTTGGTFREQLAALEAPLVGLMLP